MIIALYMQLLHLRKESLKKKVACITAMIILHLILHCAVHIYDFHIFKTSSSRVYNEPIQRPALGLRCTGIAEVKGSNSVQA